MRSSSWRVVPPVMAVIIGCSLVASCGSSSAPAAVATPGGSQAGFPVTVHAANGAVRVPSRPGAIISLSPTGTEMLYAIGAGSQVAAVGQYSDYPPHAPLTKLSEANPSVEAIAVRRPGLVVIDSEAATGLSKQLGAFHIPVLLLPAAASLADVYAQLDELGRATGHLGQAGREASSIRSQIARIVASVPKRPRPLTYYYELTTDYYSVTSDTFVGRLLGLLGLKSVADSARGAAASGGYPQLSAEFILAADPHYVFLADTVCCKQNARTVAARPGWSHLTAVKDGGVVGINDDIASRWGPRIVDLLQTVANALTRRRASP
jgi:iron complex transport system substrate-binding protein